MERGGPSTTSRIAAWVALALCVLVLLAALVVPTSTIEARSVSADGTVSDVVTTHRTLAANEGPRRRARTSR